MAVIKIPSIPRHAYNPKRPANALLLSHVRELERAVIEAGRAVKRTKPKTEEEAAAYIRHLNRALYHQALLPQIQRRPLDIAPTLRSMAARTTKPPSSRKRAKTAGARKRARKSSSARKRKRSDRR